MPELRDYLKLSLRNVVKNKLRTFLTLLGILIAVATIFTLISLSLGLTDVVNAQFEELGGDKFFVQPRGQLGPPGTEGAVSLTQEDVDVIKKIPGVSEVSYYTIGSAKIEFKDEIRFVSVAGADSENYELYFDVFTVDLLEGRFLEEGDTNEIVIGSQYALNNFFSKPVNVGDKITINSQIFEVKGILEPVGNPPDDKFISMPETQFRQLFNISERIDFIIVQVQEGEDINLVADRAERRLLNSRDLDEKTQDFTILTPEEVLESFGAVLNIITGFLLGVAAISLVVGGIGIANTMYTSVLERTKQIGIMKAIGAKNSDITKIFLLESGILGLSGGIIGIILGFIITSIIEYYATTVLATSLLSASTPLSLILGLLAFAFLAGAISGTLPAIRASKINPVTALRYE